MRPMASKRTRGRSAEDQSPTRTASRIAERPTDQIGVNLRRDGASTTTVDEMLVQEPPVCDLGERVVGMNDPNGSKSVRPLCQGAGIQRRGGSTTGATGTPVSTRWSSSTPSCRISRTTAAAQGKEAFRLMVRRLCRHGTSSDIPRRQKLKPRRVLINQTNLASLLALLGLHADTVTMATIRACTPGRRGANKALSAHRSAPSSPVPKVRGRRPECCAMEPIACNSPSSWTISVRRG